MLVNSKKSNIFPEIIIIMLGVLTVSRIQVGFCGCSTKFRIYLEISSTYSTLPRESEIFSNTAKIQFNYRYRESPNSSLYTFHLVPL